MLFVRVKSRIGGKISPSVVRCGRRKYGVPATASQEDEPKSPQSPEYPPILDLSTKAKIIRRRETWASEVQKLATIEEKMIKINMPRYYGWKSVLLNEGLIPYNSNAQMQHLTKTHVVEKPGLPSYYDRLVAPEKLKATVEKIKETLEDGLVFEYADRNRSQELDKTVLECPRELDNIASKAVSRQVHRLLMTHLAPDNPYLLETEIDHDPRIEAFWFVGGLPIPPVLSMLRRRGRLPEAICEEPVDRTIQYLGKPNFQLRHHLPLPEIIALEESEDPAFTVPEFQYEPRTTGLSNVRRHGTNIPGFWPGDTSEFGFLSYHNCGYLAKRPDSFDDMYDALKVQAVLGSWGWLLSQACNLGFSPYNDVTYPLTNQMIITNGKCWTFCAYQLNTTVLHSHHMRENPRRNICWITEPMQLFDKIEDNKVHGLNHEVLENIVKFYLNEPRSRDGVELKPYVRPEITHVANIRGPQRRAWLEERFKLMASNRPRHRRLPEIFAWQEIYLRQHKTRPVDKKREPWEFGIREWQRKLDDHCPRYIPKCLRKNKKQKWAPTYYP